MSLLVSFHTNVRSTMIYMHRLTRIGKGVWSPADSLTQGLRTSQPYQAAENIYVGTPERRWSARLGEARSIWSSGLSGPSGLFCFLTQRNQIHETDQTDQIDQMNKTGWRIFSAS
jgi:hypothetical protein